MASGKEVTFADWTFVERRNEDDKTLLEPIDPRFVKLIELNQENDFFEVDTEAVEQLFGCIDNPICIHLCLGQDLDLRSSLIIKLLTFAKQNDPLNEELLEEGFEQEISQIKEKIKKKCIVAWAESITGVTLEGKTVTHFFLDIWGAFETDDLSYILLAGVACALASSVVNIDRDELKETTWKWLKNVILVALKVQKSKDFQKLTCLVQDWKQWDKFMPGEKGGRAYIKSILDSSPEIYKDVQNFIQEILCFLLPAESNDNSLLYHQHLLGFQKQILLCGPSKSMQGEDMDGQAVVEFLQNLDLPSSYLDFEDESPFKKEEDTEEVAQVSDTSEEDEVEEEEIPIKDKESDEMDTLALEMFKDLSFNDFNKPLYKIPHASKIKEQSAIQSQSTKTTKLSYQEYLKIKTIKAAKNTIDQPEETPLNISTEAKTEESSRSISDIKPRSSNQTRNSISEESTKIMMTTNPQKIVENIFQAQIPIFKAFKLPEVDLSNLTFIPVEYIQPVQPFTEASSSGPIVQSSIGLPRMVDNEIEDHPIMFQIAINVFNEAEIQSGISVDEILEKTIALVDKENISFTKGQKQRQRKKIKSQLTLAIQVINVYQSQMDEAFKQNVFFEDIQIFLGLSKELQNSLLLNQHQSIGPFFESTKKKISDAEQIFVSLNETIKDKENKTNATYAFRLAKNLYQSKINLGTIESVDQLDEMHKKWSKISKEALVHAYGNSKPLISLEEKLNQIHDDLRIKIQNDVKGNHEEIKAKNLLKKAIDFYNSETDRNIQNGSIPSKSQFNKMTRVVFTEAINKLNLDLKVFPKEIQDQMNEELRQKIHEIFFIKMETFQKTLQNVPSSFGSQYQERKSERKQSNASTSNSSCSSEARECQIDKNSQNSQPAATVGIHFGFETLSVVTYMDGNQRQLYGPCPNIISFGKEIIIGEKCNRVPQAAGLSLNEVLQYKDINYVYEIPNWGSYRVEEIVAFVLGFVNRIVGKALHSKNIFYSIAFPSCFNVVQQRAMEDAVKIAGFKNVFLTQECCGLAAQFVQSNYNYLKNYKEQFLLLTIIENEDDSCDLILHEINGKIKPLFLNGDNPCSLHFLYDFFPWLRGTGPAPGISSAIYRLQKNKTISKNCNFLQVLLQCKGINQGRNTRLIKSSFPLAKIHLLPSSMNFNISLGMAFIARFISEEKFRLEWNQEHTEIEIGGLFNPDQAINEVHYRLVHDGSNLTRKRVMDKEKYVLNLVRKQGQKLGEVKAQGKQNCMEKLKELENSGLPTHWKDLIRTQLLNVVRAIDSEELSQGLVLDQIDKIGDLKLD